ncbi:MAG: oxygen-independent coproporphyrinogen III oxidase [Alphaproteobacteria bacterium]|nr:oxygen-independent coproporphyrinogen III oxidase [Alphaproteobacteria bacterium]
MRPTSTTAAQRLPRYTSYPTAPSFHAGIDAATYRSWLQAVDPEATASLYLHIPFCRAMCWYCGCHTTVAKSYAGIGRYAELLAREIALVADALPQRLRVGHVHWGGGTPNMLTAAGMLSLFDVLRDRFNLLPTAEIAVELDPRTLDHDRIRALGEAGVTRASIGVQDLDPAVQAAINRRQPYAQTAEAVAMLRRYGVGSINIDLMYGLPNQSVAGLLETVDGVAALLPERLALFGYAHVPWMKPHQRLISEAALPGSDERAEQYARAGERLVAHGYRRIGIDHFARAGDPLADAAASGRLHRNFQGYTTDAAPLLIGFGASSIGSLAEGYVQNEPSIAAWRERIADGGLATCRGVAVGSDDRLRGEVIERLMCDLSADVAAICAGRGADPGDLSEEMARVDTIVDNGLGWREGWRIGVSERDRPMVRALCAAFDRHLGENGARHSRLV